MHAEEEVTTPEMNPKRFGFSRTRITNAIGMPSPRVPPVRRLWPRPPDPRSPHVIGSPTVAPRHHAGD